jgi:hypothetical protein
LTFASCVSISTYTFAGYLLFKLLSASHAFASFDSNSLNNPQSVY